LTVDRYNIKKETSMTDQSFAGTAFDGADQVRTVKRVMRRIIPFIFVCYVVSYLDRINVGFAALQMNRDLGLSPLQFGWGAGLFFIGYFLCEIPSNLIMQRVGARRWIARILITWGLVSTLTCLVRGPTSFGIARFFLGMCEAGFTPGIYLFFTFWFPRAWRGRATAAFLVGIPVANIVGSPISGALLTLDGLGGLHGWQWLLILEGVPACVLGIACLFVLSDGPDQAPWLPDREKRWLAETLAGEHAATAARHGGTLRAAFSNPRVFGLAFINFCGIVGSLGVGIWLPQIVKGFGLDYLTVGFVAAAPYLIGIVSMLLWGNLADRASRRMPYVVGALAIAALALAISANMTSPLLAMVFLTITVSGILSFQATFWAIPQRFLTGRAAAGGLALIVSVGNLGGFVGPSLIGAIRQQVAGFTVPLMAIAAILLLGVIAQLIVGDPSEDK
jgi:MFS family permease